MVGMISKMTQRLIALSLSLLILSGCVHSPKKQEQGFRFNSVEVFNQTRSDIFNMKIEVTKFHRKFACGIILRESLCMNGFHPRVLQSNDVVISWDQDGQHYEIGPIRPQAPEDYDPNTTHAIQFIFIDHHRVEMAFPESRY